MNYFVIFDIIKYVPERTLLSVGDNLLGSRYHGRHFQELQVITTEAFYRSAIDYFENGKILHIKRKLPLISLIDQNHFHYDGFYGACLGGHFDLIQWIWDQDHPSLGMGYQGARKAERHDVVLFLDSLGNVNKIV